MQSNGVRALIALAAVVVLVVGFIVLTGEDDAGVGSADPPVASTSDETSGDSTTKDDEGLTGLGSDPAKEVPAIIVKDGAPEGGVAELEYDVGDEVRFAVESDAADEVHVHGYDIEQEVGAGETVEFDFPADIDGIYEVEMHSSEAQIAQLTVNP